MDKDRTTEDRGYVNPATKPVSRFVRGLAQEGDRSAVILGAARLDVALETLLKSVMCHHPGGSDNLFDPERPLGSLSAKIALAHRLRLIDRDVEHALQMIRKLRNDFAHSIERASLSDAPHKDRAAELVRTVCKDKDWENFKAWFSQNTQAGSLAEFCAAITLLIVVIEVQSQLQQEWHRKDDWSTAASFE